MEKFYFQFLTAFLTGNKRHKKALKIILACTLSCISYSGFAQVVVSPANDTVICSKTAIGGSAPSCTSLGVITLTETANSDFATGADQIVLAPPAGWQFCTGTAPTYSPASGDITAVGSGAFTSSSLTVNITAGGTAAHDVITITGLQVQPLSTSAVAGIIYATGTTGITGISLGPTGTSFGKLGVIPAPITTVGAMPTSICTGNCITLSDATPGGIWSSSAPAIATVSPGGVVCGLATGSVTINYTVAGCASSVTFSILPSPAPITGYHNMCAWYDSLSVSDATSGGLYSSTGVTTINLGAGNGKVHANAPSAPFADTIFYTTTNGCSVFALVTVNPLPKPFSFPPYTVCQGSSTILFDSLGPGTWTSSVPTVASVTPIGTDSVSIHGNIAGVTVITYTLAGTGCYTDTTFTVNPLPLPITGDTEVCALSTTTLHDGTVGGSWSSSNPTVGIIDATTGIFTGVNPGTTVVLYTLPTGCAQVTTVTVDPLPDSVTGPTTVCVGQTITLSDATTPGKWISTNGHVATIDSITGVLTGDTAGTVVILYTIQPGGCHATYVVTVDSLPSPILGDSVVCQGSFLSFADSTVGGTWSSVPTSVGTIDPVSGTFGGISPGITSVCYTLASTTGCAICENVTVNVTPAPIVGTDTLCVGSTVILTDVTLGGTWSTHDPSVATIDPSGLVTGISAGPDIDTYSIGSCFAVFYLTVDPVPPAITGSPAVCVGDSVLLTDVLSGGVWTSSNSAVASIDQAGWVTGVSSGTAFITYTMTAGGCDTIFTMVVNAKDSVSGPHTMCQGDTITLTNPDAGGTWTHTQYGIDSFVAVSAFPSPFVNIWALTTGTGGYDTITYTLPSGCASTFVIKINPITPIFGTSSSVCVGDSVTVFDITPGGMWSISPTSSATITPFGGVVKGISAGVDTITYTIAATGCHATELFTVNPLPVPISGPTTVCVGDSVQLIDTSTGGSWTALNNHATVDTGGWVTGVSSGVDTIRYSFATTTNCAVYYVITVNPLSPIFGADSVCVGLSITHADSTHGGTWTNSNPTIGSIDTVGTYTGLTAGVDTIFYTLPTGCVAFEVITVNGLPGPISGIDSVCVGSTRTLSDVPGGGTWSMSNGNATIGSTSGIYLGVSPGLDTVTYTLSTSCSITTVVTVDLTPLPISGVNHVCLARTITLTDGTPGGVWTDQSPTIAAVTTVAGNAQVHGLALGTDIVTYTLPTGACYVTMTVSVTPIPTITVNHPPIKCKYTPVVLTASGANTYAWSPAYGLSSTAGAVVIATPTITTTYTVRGTDAMGCDSFTTVTVIVDDSLNNMKIVGQDSICAGTCDLLQASGRAGSYFDWHPATGLSCTICDTVTACPATTTTYWAVAIDDLGCKDSVSFTVTVNPVPDITVNPNPTILCKRTPLQVQMSTTNTDNATTTWAWSPNLFLSCDSCSNPILTDTNNIIYNVIATSKYGCYDSFKVKVSVLDTNVNTVSIDTNICAGTVATLVATSHSLYSNLDVPTFTWLPDYKLSNPDSSWTLAFPDTTTTYSVAIHENACFSDTLNVTVFVQPYPQFYLTPGSPFTTVAGTPVQIIADITNTPIAHFLWTPAATLTCDTCYNPVAIPTTNTTYVVTATSIYGCSTKDSLTILIGCDQSQVFIPNTFTPNGDGVNDRFFISAKGVTIINNFNVYNRWGQQVFSAQNIKPNDPAAGWDGTFKGLVLEPDVFVYTVEATCEIPGNPPLKYKGDVSIVK